MSKSQILKIGELRNFPKIFENFSTQRIKIYGLYFDQTVFNSKKSDEQGEKAILQIQNMNLHSNFSLVSRSIFVNTYFLSKFWYAAAFIQPSDELIQLANKAIRKFLWYPSRMPKMKGSMIKNSKISGGIGAPHRTLK